ncbi:hypothetical protein AB0395_33035 [Streptosporangium sp. NPDC051023]|uniref:hypothetical protein n=1 Tax=Streptosporangium sp. NPDC051023 TaxID=3155410 RepID=UPI00344DA4D7
MSDGKCTQCGHEGLEPGFISDPQTHRPQRPGFAIWVEGELKRGFFGGVKLRDRPKWQVEAHRCPNCSHLELFANHLLPDYRL